MACRFKQFRFKKKVKHLRIKNFRTILIKILTFIGTYECEVLYKNLGGSKEYIMKKSICGKENWEGST